MVETKVVILREAANHQATEGEKTPVYHATKRVVHLVVARGDINAFIDMEVDNLANSRDFV